MSIGEIGFWIGCAFALSAIVEFVIGPMTGIWDPFHLRLDYDD